MNHAPTPRGRPPLPAQVKRQKLGITLPPDLIAAAKARCSQTGEIISQLIERVLLLHFDPQPPTMDPTHPEITIRTLQARHLKQLRYIHDEDYDFSAGEILGQHQGFLIVRKPDGNLDQVSIAVKCIQNLKTMDHDEALKESHSYPQLFTED